MIHRSDPQASPEPSARPADGEAAPTHPAPGAGRPEDQSAGAPLPDSTDPAPPSAATLANAPGGPTGEGDPPAGGAGGASRPKRLRRLRAKFALRGRELGVFLRGLGLLALTGFSLAFFIMQLTGTFDVVAFVNDNDLPRRARLQMLGWLAIGTAGGLATALTLFLRGPRPAAARAARVLRTARLLSPLALFGPSWAVLAARNWDALPRIGGIGFLALLGETAVRSAAGEIIAPRTRLGRTLARAGGWLTRTLTLPRWPISPAMLIVVLAALFYAAWMGTHSILQHLQFGTMAFDLGSFDTTFFNALHGHPFRSTAVLRSGEDWSMLSNHAEFTMYALLPFYALRPGPETLLVLQAVGIASGAIPLYRFASRRLPVGVALVLAFAYLLYAPMHQANFYDFHFQPLAAAFTLWALDMLDRDRPVLFAVFFALTLGCREDVPIGFIIVGLFLLMTGQRVRAAAIMTAVSIAYFVIIKFVVMPQFGSWWFSDLYKDLYPRGEGSYGGVVKTLLTNPVYVWKTLVTPEKIVFFLLVMTPLVFLPLRRGLLWMSLLAGALVTLITTGYSPTIEISFQYVCLYIPFIFLAAVLALTAFGTTRAGRARMWGAAGGIAVATILTSRVWGAMPPGDKFRGGFREIPAFRLPSEGHREKKRDIDALIAKIPADAAVAVSEMEHPHASTRLNCYALRLGHEGADYILYAEGSGEHGSDNARKALDSKEYEVMERRPRTGMTLLRRIAPAAGEQAR